MLVHHPCPTKHKITSGRFFIMLQLFVCSISFILQCHFSIEIYLTWIQLTLQGIVFCFMCSIFQRVLFRVYNFESLITIP